MGSGRHGQLFSPSGPGSSCSFLYWLDERKALLSGPASYQLFISFRRVLQRTHTVLRIEGDIDRGVASYSLYGWRGGLRGSLVSSY